MIEFDDETLTARLRGLGSNQSSGRTSSVPGPRLVDGVVALDSAHGGLDGLRSAMTFESRQVVVTGDAMTIVMDVVPDRDDLVVITGQVIGADQPVVVQLFNDLDEEVALLVTDELGDFECSVAARMITLIAATDACEVSIRIDLGAAR